MKLNDTSGVTEAPAPLTDERILHLWDTHVAYETNPNRPKQPPLDDKDKLAFARAVLVAAGVTAREQALRVAGAAGPLGDPDVLASGVLGTATPEDRSHLACPFDDLPAWRDTSGVGEVPRG